MIEKTDKTERLHMSAPTSLIRWIDDWRRLQPDLPNLSEAVRRLVAVGLKHENVPQRKRAEAR